MSTESTTAMSSATEPVPGAEEKKIEASEAPSQTQQPAASEATPAAVPAVAETEVESEVKPKSSDGPVVVPPPASAAPASTNPEKEKKAVEEFYKPANHEEVFDLGAPQEEEGNGEVMNFDDLANMESFHEAV